VTTRDAPDVRHTSTPRSGLGRFSSFVVVGAVGFVVDGGILATLIHFYAWSHVSARAVSFAVAVTVTWYCNRRWVFGPTNDRVREYGAYLGVQAAGALINLGTYLLLIALFPALARLPLLPFAAGSALALLFNYSGAHRWVFAARAKDG
jgi:putative flippase GtrA